jgi:hypothetical protein
MTSSGNRVDHLDNVVGAGLGRYVVAFLGHDGGNYPIERAVIVASSSCF